MTAALVVAAAILFTLVVGLAAAVAVGVNAASLHLGKIAAAIEEQNRHYGIAAPARPKPPPTSDTGATSP